MESEGDQDIDLEDLAIELPNSQKICRAYILDDNYVMRMRNTFVFETKLTAIVSGLNFIVNGDKKIGIELTIAGSILTLITAAVAYALKNVLRRRSLHI